MGHYSEDFLFLASPTKTKKTALTLTTQQAYDEQTSCQFVVVVSKLQNVKKWLSFDTIFGINMVNAFKKYKHDRYTLSKSWNCGKTPISHLKPIAACLVLREKDNSSSKLLIAIWVDDATLKSNSKPNAAWNIQFVYAKYTSIM